MQYLVTLERPLSWQRIVYLVKFWEIAEPQHVVLSETKSVSEVGKVSSANGRVADARFMRIGFGSCSNPCSSSVAFRGRRNIGENLW